MLHQFARPVCCIAGIQLGDIVFKCVIPRTATPLPKIVNSYLMHLLITHQGLCISYLRSNHSFSNIQCIIPNYQNNSENSDSFVDNVELQRKNYDHSHVQPWATRETGLLEITILLKYCVLFLHFFRPSTLESNMPPTTTTASCLPTYLNLK